MIARTRLIVGAVLIAVAGAFALPAAADNPGKNPGTEAVKPGDGEKKVENKGKPNTEKKVTVNPDKPGMISKRELRRELKRKGFVKVSKLRLIKRGETKIGRFGVKRVKHAGSYFTAVVKTKKGKTLRLFIDAKTGKTFARKVLA